jgi:hypothetical protein
MENNLGLLEEFDIEREIKTPHLMYRNFSTINKKRVAYSILSRKLNEIILINSPGFCVDAVFAGLSEKHIEYIAKNAPMEYKKNILDLLYQANIENILKITQDMDKDLGENVTQNQDRLKNIIQYIKDNHAVFEFN